MTYTEKKESYLLPIGFERSADCTVSFSGVSYQIKVLGAFVKDEDGIPLLKIRISFPETPLTRYIKLYYHGAHPHLKQYERPGSDFVLAKVLELKRELLTAPLIGTPLSHIDDDYLRYRIEKKFIPDIHLVRSVAQTSDIQKGKTS